MIVRRTLKWSALLAVILGFAVITMFSAAIYTYAVLTDEAEIAEIYFEAVGPQHFTAHLATNGGCARSSIDIFGDQWRIDAEFLKWKNWALYFGLDAQYRLERFEGRYRDINEQNSRRTLAYDITEGSAVDIPAIAGALGRWNFLVDAAYGSSTYQDIDPERLYRVYRTQTGLITRDEPLPRARPGEAMLTIEVDRACGGEPNYWERFAAWADGAVRGLVAD
jgi:hypothetical protein